jgi:hypothetical protein
VTKLKAGAPFLVYLYYAFDNRPWWFRSVWHVSDVGRRIVSRLPTRVRLAVADAIAASVYLPLSRAAALVELTGLDVSILPLSAYRRASFYTMRTDALDRFGTRLEQRFTAAQVKFMMEEAGLQNVIVSDRLPFWTAVGTRAP